MRTSIALHRPFTSGVVTGLDAKIVPILPEDESFTYIQNASFVFCESMHTIFPVNEETDLFLRTSGARLLPCPIEGLLRWELIGGLRKWLARMPVFFHFRWELAIQGGAFALPLDHFIGDFFDDFAGIADDKGALRYLHATFD